MVAEYKSIPLIFKARTAKRNAGAGETKGRLEHY